MNFLNQSEVFLAKRQSRNRNPVKESTMTSYRSRLANHILPAIGILDLESFGNGAMKTFAQGLSTKGLGPKTILETVTVVKLIMASWAVYPALGARPAGLSPNVVQGELRGRLDFTGVTITDALEAGALGPFGSTQHRTLRAALAGMDLMLCAAQNVTQGQQASAELAADYTDGTLNGPAFLASVNRVITLRQSLA